MANDKITGKKAKSVIIDDAPGMGKPDARGPLGNMLELKTFDPDAFAKGGYIMGYDPAKDGKDVAAISSIEHIIPKNSPHHAHLADNPQGKSKKIGTVKSIDYTYDIETISNLDPTIWKTDWGDLELKIAAELKGFQDSAYKAVMLNHMYGGMTSNVASADEPESPTLKELCGLMEKHAHKTERYAHMNQRAYTPHRLVTDLIPFSEPEISHPDNLKQAIFDRVLMGMRRQRCKAVNIECGRVTSCQYRSPTGARCAVGMMIPDERYRKSLEGRVTNDVAYAAGIPPHMIRPEILDFLTDVQANLHDRIPAGEDFMYIFEAAAHHFAFKNNLTYRPPGTKWAASVQFAASFAPPSENNTAFKDTHEFWEF